MLPGVHTAVEAFRPDVLVADQQALAGPLVGAPARSALGDLGDHLGGAHPAVRRLPEGGGVGERSASPHCSPSAGRPAGWDPRFSPHLVLVFSTPALIGADERSPPHYAFVGPAFGPRPPPATSRGTGSTPARARVLVSLGTLNRAAGARFYPAVLRAAEPSPTGRS